MGLQKYRADVSRSQPDGAVVWSTSWMGGPSLAKVENCRLDKLEGEPRATVYATSEPDTFFSIPAACRFLGVTMRGYLTTDDDGNLIFRHTYY